MPPEPRRSVKGARQLYQARLPRTYPVDWYARQNRENPLVAKLSAFVALGHCEAQALNSISSNVRRLSLTETLILEGERSSFVHLIITGFAYRYKHLLDGRRQICGYLLPGDLCDTHFALRSISDHSVGLLSDADVAMIPAHELLSVMIAYPRIERALQLARLAEDATLREWILNVGQRGAIQKLASFFCEMSTRLELVGETKANRWYDLPVTQTELADTLGLTTGHVNRILQQLRREGIFAWGRGRFAILDPDRLQSIAEFNGAYLRFAFAAAELN